MKNALLVITWMLSLGAKAQDSSLQKYEGAYGKKDSVLFHILARGKTLYMDLSHYGKMPLASEGPDQFTMVHVRPKATLIFKGDTLIMHQIGAFTYIRDSAGSAAPSSAGSAGGAAASNSGATTSDGVAALTGRYHQDIDAYAVIRLSDSAGQLHSDGHPLIAQDPTHFKVRDDSTEIVEFILDKQGQAKKFIIHKVAPEIFVRMHDAQSASYAVLEHASSRKNGFTRADTLLGMLTPIRTCYDVTFYGLDLKFDPLARTIQGSGIIRYKTLAAFDSLQIDLYMNLVIDSIIWKKQVLTYSREYNAVYVHFPGLVAPGSIDEIKVYYHGSPRLPDLSNLKGGFFYYQNNSGQPWVESVTQGTGASVFFPCKDHNSDKPDSMKISVTVPKGLTDISNGTFMGSTDLPGNLTRWDWYVHEPMNAYDVVLNVGNYKSFTASYVNNGDTIPLRFYYQSYDEGVAHELAAEVPSMLDIYIKDFGPFPFPKDGYGLVDNFWPMEHSTAISIGYFSNQKGKPVPVKELIHSLWHESAHEWWGNSVTCSDYADFWIHESFATYAEVLKQEVTDPAGALKYLAEGVPANKDPMIGVYNVNNFKWGDIYTRGPLMIHTLRHCIGNDSLFFAILRGIQSKYKYQSIRTEDIVNAFNQATGFNYTPVFDQYLRNTGVPVLQLAFHQSDSGLVVRYNWKAEVSGFAMPIQTSAGRLNATSDTQTLTIPFGKEKDFTVDTQNFYVKVERSDF